MPDPLSNEPVFPLPDEPPLRELADALYKLAFEQYFQAGMYNEAAAMDEVRLRRVFPIGFFMYSEADIESLAEDVVKEIQTVLNDEGCDLVISNRVHGSGRGWFSFAQQREPATRRDHEQCQERIWDKLKTRIQSSAGKMLMFFVIGANAFLPVDHTSAIHPSGTTIQQQATPEHSRWHRVEIDLAEVQKLLEHALKITQLVRQLIRLLRGRTGTEATVKRLEEIEKRLQELERTKDLQNFKQTVLG